MARKQPVSITSAATSHSDELGARQRRYLIGMLLRTACFIGFVAIDHPIRWVLLAAAAFLPYFSVVLANATGITRRFDDAEFVQTERPALERPDTDD